MSQTFPLAYSLAKQPQDIILDLVGKLGRQEHARLAFIYATDANAPHLKAIIDALRLHTGIPHWVGSIGLGICCTGHEFYDEPAVTVMVTDFSEDQFDVFTDTQKLLDSPPVDGLRFTVVHGEPRNGQLPQLIAQLPEQMGNGYLVGGLTSASQYYYQLADDITEGRLSGVAFKPSVKVVSGLSQGCSPIGPAHEITDCEGHLVQELDHRPALDVMKEDIGEVLSRDLNRIGGYIFAGFPVAESDTGDYLVRNLIGIDLEHQYIGIGEYLQHGQQVMFCRRDGQTAIEDLKRMLSDIQQRLPSPAKGGLYFSCLGRGKNLFGEQSQEMKLIAEQLGNIPLVGFYANGEIAGQRLYGYTGVLSLFY